jgi:hypothetical protein
MNDKEHLDKITGALKLISEGLQTLDKRVKLNTDLIGVLAGIDVPKLRNEMEEE